MRFRNIIRSILFPTFLAIVLFFLVRPVLAQLVGEANPPEITEVGVEIVNDYSHVYYMKGNEKKFVTEGSRNSRHPDANGEYMAWISDLNGIGQVYRYHVPSGSLIEISGAKNNQKPKVSLDGKVVWEGWIVPEGEVDGNWQIFLFDGVSVSQLTSGELSINPDVEGDYAVFGRRDNEGVWRTEGYSIAEKKSATVKVGDDAKFPSLKGEEVVLAPPGREEQVEPLKIQDLLLLDNSLVPEVNSLEEVPEVSSEDIREELGEESILPESQ